MINKKNQLCSAVISCLLISACGSSSSSNDSDPGGVTPDKNSTDFSVTAMTGDAYLKQSDVLVDDNVDGVCEKQVGRTDDSGQITLTGLSADTLVCVNTENSQFKALASNGVINPLTDIAVTRKLTSSQLASQLDISDASIFQDYLSLSESDHTKSQVVARSLAHAKTHSASEGKLFDVLTADNSVLSDLDSIINKLFVLNDAGQAIPVLGFSSDRYADMVEVAPECGRFTLPEHLDYIEQPEVLTQGEIEDDIFDQIKDLSASAALDAILSQADDIADDVKNAIRQCSSLTNGNRIHDFSGCSDEVRTLLSELYQDAETLQLICQVTRDQVNLAVLPIVIDNYQPQGSTVTAQINARFGNGSFVDEYLEKILGLNVNIAVAQPLNVTGVETDDEYLSLLPYHDQIITQSLLLADGSALEPENYDQIAVVYVSDGSVSLGNFGNIFEPVELDDGTELSNRFISNSRLTEQPAGAGLDNEQGSLSSDQVVFVHEYFHGLGVEHASISPCSYQNFTNGSKAFSDFETACSWDEISSLNAEIIDKMHDNFDEYFSFNYGAVNGVMGGQGSIGQEMMPYYQYRLGRVDTAKVQHVRANQTVEMFSFDPDTDTTQLIHLQTEKGHYWFWFNAKNTRFDWMIEDQNLASQNSFAPMFGEAITIASVSGHESEQLLIIPFNYQLSTPNDKGSLSTRDMLFENGTYTIDNVEVNVSDSRDNSKTLSFTYN